MRGEIAVSGAVVAGVVVPDSIPAWRQEAVRLGVFQPWTASIDEGWARWVLEQYGQPYTTLQTADIRQGGLGERFDAILIPEMSAQDLISGRPEKTPEKDPYPPEYVGGLGEAGLEMLRRFVADGGTIVATDNSASAIADALALPVEQPLRDVPAETFSCPGSLLRVVVDNHVRAAGILRSQHYQVTERDVVAVTVPHDAGGLSAAVRLLAEAGVNIEYAYGGAADGMARALVVIGVEDAARAAAAAGV